MSRTPARQLQRLAEAEIGEAPKLSLCGTILARQPPRDPSKNETREMWLARVYLENETSLRLSAAQRKEERVKCRA